MRAVAAPVERGVGHDRERHAAGAVDLAGAILVASAIFRDVERKHGGAPRHLAFDRLGVRIEQQLVRIAAHAASRIPRAVHAKAISLAGCQAGDIAVPAEGPRLGQVHPPLVAGVVEETQLHARRDFGEQREVAAAAVVRRCRGDTTDRARSAPTWKTQWVYPQKTAKQETCPQKTPKTLWVRPRLRFPERAVPAERPHSPRKPASFNLSTC